MLYILGNMVARTTAGDGTDVLHIFKPVSATLTGASEELIARGFGFDEAPLQDLDSAENSNSWTLTLSQESVDNLDLQQILDIREDTVSLALPVVKKVAIPAAPGPYTVTETGLTVDQDVVATILSDTGPLYLERIASAGTVASGQFEVTANTLTFHADQAEESAVIMYLAAAASTLMIGGTTPAASYGEMSFYGILKGTRIRKKFYAPRIKRSAASEKTLGVSGQVTAAEMAYKVLTPSGWPAPFAIWNAA